MNSAMVHLSLNDKLNILQAGWGRCFGWNVELEGQRIADLIDPQSRDVCWDSYAIVNCDRDTIYSEEFWKSNSLSFRNIEYPDYCIESFGIYENNKRVLARDLFIPIRFSLAEKIFAPFRYFKAYSSANSSNS